MFKQNQMAKTSLKINTSYQGETIEEKVMRIVNNKEPIKDGAPLIYTDRKEGVRPDMDIRTDRFELAIDAMNIVESSNRAKREAFHKSLEEKNNPKKDDKPKDGGAEPIQGTNTEK